VGLRVPAHPLALELLARFGGGVAAPSANRFGAVSPTTADHVEDLGSAVDYLLDGGPCAVGVESTIVDLSRGRAVLLRPGGLARDTIEAITGPLALADRDAPAAPGTLASHYAPRAAVIAAEPAEVPAALAAARGRVALLAPRSMIAAWARPGVVAHALPDDDAGMARELYAALRELDAIGVDVIVAALPPAAGLGEAVGDRLRRAGAAKRES
jgi:L-threonylcarbamoyladenylate synthase